MNTSKASVRQDAKAARLAVIMVNWNGWEVTIEALESVLRSDTPLRVIVVDNGSTDGTLERLKAWASGAEPYEAPAGPMRRFSHPQLEKPIGLTVLTAADSDTTPPSAERVTVIASPDNLGFSGGNNLGLRHALLDPAIAYCWCLNNDTVVEATAAAALIARMDATHRIGMCGTVLRYYGRPDTIQALNGMRFSALTAA